MFVVLLGIRIILISYFSVVCPHCFLFSSLSLPNFPLLVFSWFRLCALFLLVWLIDVVLFPGL